MRKDYGMLGELGLEVGDVVTLTKDRFICEKVVWVVQYGDSHGNNKDKLCAVYDTGDEQGFMYCDNMSEGWDYQVIIRANHKREPEIKTGILAQKIGKVEITTNGKIWMQHVRTSKDLDAAIVTLQAISAKLKELNQ